MFPLMFKNTIFDNDRSVKQKDAFQYLHILLPLNTRTQFTIMIWERMFEIMREEDEGSVWDTDME